MRAPEIELLWWQGCPSTERARDELRRVLDEIGLAGAEVRSREIRSDAEAREAGFVGSPTIRIDGVDISDPGEEPAGLTCRLYQLRDGRYSAVPDPDDLRDALRRALTNQEPA